MPCYKTTALPSGFTTTGKPTYKTEAECIEACRACGECPEQIAAGDMPASFTMHFNQKPSIKVHGCHPFYYPTDTTLDLDGSYAVWTDPNTGQPTNTPTRFGRVVARSDWQPLDVFSENLWSPSVVLTKQPTFPHGINVPETATLFYSNGGLFAGGTTLSAGVWVSCAYMNKATGKPVWKIVKAYAAMPSYLRLTSTWFNRFFVRDPVWTITPTQLIWESSATVDGNSAYGFSVSSADGVFNQAEVLPPVVIPCSPSSNATASSAVVSAISVMLRDNPLP